MHLISILNTDLGEILNIFNKYSEYSIPNTILGTLPESV